MTYKNFLRLWIFQPKMSLLNRVLGVLVSFRANVLGVFLCLRARMLGMSACLVFLLHSCLACPRAYMFTCLACLLVLCPYVFTCFACLLCSNILHAYMLLWHRLSYFLRIWKVNFQKSFDRKIYSRKYLEPTWTSMKEFFAKKN